MEAIRERHSVRQYLDRPLGEHILEELRSEVELCNKESGLEMQLVLDEPLAFSSRMASYGHFDGVSNYLAVIGPKEKGLEEKCGYYGEHFVLKAQMLGLNSCWVGLTYKKVRDAYVVAPGKSLVIVIPFGYGASPGSAHKIKTVEEVTECAGPMPDWFLQGTQAALLAPTAMNQQKFKLILEGQHVQAKAQLAPFAKLDLGIVKYHFEVGAGKGPDIWMPA